jgi:hypothetical protein
MGIDRRWNDIDWWKKTVYSEKNLYTFSTTNPTDLRLNSGLRGGRLATNGLRPDYLFK